MATAASKGTSSIRVNLGRFFGHFPQVEAIFTRLDELVQHSCEDEEPECIAIVGETGTGKSRLLKRFSKRWRRERHATFTEVPVLYVQVPPKCTVKMLAGAILYELKSPFWARGDELERTHQLTTLLSECKVRMVILDEVNHLADRGAQKSHYHVGDWIKQLVSKARIPVVLAGTHAASVLWDTNEQLADRYREILRLKPLSPDRLEELRSVLAVFGKLVADIPCIDVAAVETATAIAAATGGRLRDIKLLFRHSVELAEKRARPAITRAVFSRAFSEVIYENAPPERNPFRKQFNKRPLTAYGEPYAPRSPLR